MTGGCLLTIAVVTGSGCLLFTDPINMPPTVEIVMAPAEIWHGQPVTFQASVSDPNGDAVTLDWARAFGRCSNIPAPGERTPGPTLPVGGTDTEMSFCVWAFATDSHSATAHASLQVDPLDHAPTAAISIVQPNPVPLMFPLYSTLEFSGAGSTDADPTDLGKLTYNWTLARQPTGSVVSLVDCQVGADSASKCLKPDKPGDYQVKLVVDDAFPSAAVSTSLPATKIVTVAADGFPCLDLTTPSRLASTVVRDPSDPSGTVFAVLRVVDDGDPYPDPSPIDPMAGAHFSWFLGRERDPVAYFGPHDFPTYTVAPGTFALGDTARVRVEIHDRPNAARIDDVLLGCGDEPVCEAQPGSGCFQRMTWIVEYRL